MVNQQQEMIEQEGAGASRKPTRSLESRHGRRRRALCAAPWCAAHGGRAPCASRCASLRTPRRRPGIMSGTAIGVPRPRGQPNPRSRPAGGQRETLTARAQQKKRDIAESLLRKTRKGQVQPLARAACFSRRAGRPRPRHPAWLARLCGRWRGERVVRNGLEHGTGTAVGAILLGS